MYRNGQSWTVDFALSLLLFFLVTPLAVQTLTNSFTGSTYTAVKEDTITISEHLLSTGDPQHWEPGNVNRIGLTADEHRINTVKLDRYHNISYADARTLFGSRHEHAVYFTRNGTVRSVRDECVLGSDNVTETKTLQQEMRAAAYYAPHATILSSVMNTVDADSYGSDSTSFYQNLSRYHLLALEDPRIADTDGYTETEQRDLLEQYVKKGGVLILTGNVSMNFTSVGFNATEGNDGKVVDTSPEELNLQLGYNVTDADTSDTDHAVHDLGAENFTSLAEYGNGRSWLARWEKGLGKGFYLATVDGTYENGEYAGLEQKVGEIVQDTVNITKANCTSIGTDSLPGEQVARTERLVIRDRQPTRLVVLAWN